MLFIIIVRVLRNATDSEVLSWQRKVNFFYGIANADSWCGLSKRFKEFKDYLVPRVYNETVFLKCKYFDHKLLGEVIVTFACII